MKSWTPPTVDMIERVLSSVKKETDRQYFFNKLKNPLWMQPLRERGFFSYPPAAKQLPEGFVQYPYWPELSYLVSVAEEAADQVVDIVLAMPKTDNPRVYEGFLEVALKLEGSESAALLPKIIEYTELENQSLAYRYSELLAHWGGHGFINESLEILKRIIPFRADPRSDEKWQLRKKDPQTLKALLEPAPQFSQWEYQQILEVGVRGLVEHKPYEVACILIDATAGMIQMGFYSEELEKGREEDYSEIWCRRLDKPDRDYSNVKEDLVHSLTYACEKVYEKEPASVEALDRVLRSQRWRVFMRLRQQLYALHPNEQTLPWIRDFILGYKDYSESEYCYEMQLMIREASEYFGYSLLCDKDRATIFYAIFSGPSKDRFRAWMGEKYTEEAFQKRQRYFHRMQFRPFEKLLSGDYKRYFDELEFEAQGETISDESYSPYGQGVSGVVTYQSPKSSGDLGRLNDDELLAYINDWEEERRDKDNWLVEISISALAGEFQSLFKERISSDRVRLAYWMTHRDQIARPVYVVAIVKAMQDLVRANNYGSLEDSFELCSWILSHQDLERKEGQSAPRDESRNYPDWGTSRRAVVEFIDACLSKDANVPISARCGLANLLRQVCLQFDWRLDRNQPVLLNHDDPITEAINNTRSRALESLINLGFWIRRYAQDDPVPEVTEILSHRVDKDAEFPLTRPEYALLGMNFGNVCFLNREWAEEKRPVLFPQSDPLAWRAAFGGYINYSRPSKLVFEILREDFEYALAHLDALQSRNDDEKEFVDRLGQHLFTYYLWQVYPLAGGNSLLEDYYQKTSDDRRRWASLFNHVGLSLRNSGKNLDSELIDHAVAYCDWRLGVGEPQELQEFTFWLKAECLDPEWRLRSYSKILDYGRVKNMGISMEIGSLKELSPGFLQLTVECFAKITDAIDQNLHMYISAEDAKPILKAGLSAGDSQTRENARRARENLLRNSRFDFLDIE